MDQDLCYDFSDVEEFMNRRDVRIALGVDPDKKWQVCNKNVWGNLLRDMDNDASAELAVGNFFIAKN